MRCTKILPEPLTKTEYAELISHWNQDSWKILAERNIRFALLISRWFHGDLVEEEELESIALLELVIAARTFDHERGIKFTAYAGKVIRNKIYAELKKNQQKQMNEVSLESPINENCEEDGDESVRLIEVISFTSLEEEVKRYETINTIKKELQNLSPRDQGIIILRMQDIKQEEIAKEAGIAQSLVSRIIRNFIKEIKSPFKTTTKGGCYENC